MKEYRHNVRGIEEIHKYGKEFYRRLIEERRGFLDCVLEAYEGIEHKPGEFSEKLPNITRVWNLPFNAGGFMYGSTLGHRHENYDFDVQEIYEFWNKGGMLISFNEGNKLFVCKSGDKVVVPPKCMMTILNFSVDELETLDMANPSENASSKAILEGRGPMIAFYHTGMQNGNLYCSSFKCSSYLSQRFGRRIDFPLEGIVKMRLNSRYDNFGIKEDAEVEFFVCDGGFSGEIIRKKDELARYNIEVIEASDSVSCKGRDGQSYIISEPLEKLVVRRDKIVHRILGMV